MKAISLTRSLVAMALFSIAHVTSAHELVIKPEKSTVAKGESLPVSIYMTEVYLKPGRMPAKDTTLTLHSKIDSKEVTITSDKQGKRFAGDLTNTTNQPFILLAKSAEQRSLKPGARGYEKLKKKLASTSDVINARSESYAKALINSAADSTYHAHKLGTPLELILLDNPAKLAVGDKLRVQVLQKGKPVKARVAATYNGYSSEEHGYTTKTQSNDDGVALVDITSAGLWMVRSKIDLDGSSKALDQYEMSTSIVFNIEL